jgi:hypothetical protein
MSIEMVLPQIKVHTCGETSSSANSVRNDREPSTSQASKAITIFVLERLKTRSITEPSVPGTNVQCCRANIQPRIKESVDLSSPREAIISKLRVTEVIALSGEIATRWLPVGEADIVRIRCGS